MLKLTGRHRCKGLFFNRVVGLRPATLLKKRLWHGYFPVNFAKFLRIPFYIEHLRWLFLNLFQKTYYSEHSLPALWKVLFILDENTFIKNFYANYFLSLIELDVLFALNLVLLLLNRINVYPFSHERNKYSKWLQPDSTPEPLSS